MATNEVKKGAKGCVEIPFFEMNNQNVNACAFLDKRDARFDVRVLQAYAGIWIHEPCGRGMNYDHQRQ
jgi:hypothetical protein